MDFLKENKVLAFILIGAVVLVGGYFALFSGTGGGSESGLLSSSSGTSNTSKISAELLSTIGDLKGISLDNKIFSDKAYQALVDFHVDIPLLPVGRDNPFTAFPGMKKTGTPGAAQGTLSVPSVPKR